VDHPRLRLPGGIDDRTDGRARVPSGVRHLNAVTSGIGRATHRVGMALGRLRTSPALVRWIALLLSLAVPVVAVGGGPAPLFAAGLVVLAAVTGTLDATVAARTGRLTRLGVVYDPVVDRLCELCWLVAIWLLGAPAALVVVGGVLTGLYEYIRARAMLVGMTGRGVATIGGRSARIVLVTSGLAFAGFGDWATGMFSSAGFSAGMATITAVGWALLAIFGLAQLLVAMHEALR
jgi:CDP-diacylglycerol--glycerol-3-phosphate 3-phosphatidyltransferase